MVLRAGFMGSPAFAVPSLRAVARTCDLRVVVCQPDRPAGRGLELAPPAVKLAAAEYDVPILQPVKMKDGTLAAALREHALDVVIVTAFGRILPPDILALPRHGCINVHASVLPRWRGAAPIQRAILAGDRETGVSIMQMDEGLDTGAVFTTVTTPIGPSETSGELFERLAELGGDALATFLSAFPDVAPPQPQDHDAATHAPMLRKDEGVVDWQRSATNVVDHIRGMDPWPGAVTSRGGAPLKLFRASVHPHTGSHEPGTVLSHDNGGLVVACLGSAVTVAEVQPAGKRRMSAAAYAAGKPFAVNERLGEAHADED
jgi:methionyl-tRNA formyltransferase